MYYTNPLTKEEADKLLAEIFPDEPFDGPPCVRAFARPR